MHDNIVGLLVENKAFALHSYAESKYSTKLAEAKKGKMRSIFQTAAVRKPPKVSDLPPPQIDTTLEPPNIQGFGFFWFGLMCTYSVSLWYGSYLIATEVSSFYAPPFFFPLEVERGLQKVVN